MSTNVSAFQSVFRVFVPFCISIRVGCMNDLTAEKSSFDLQAAWVIDVLGLFFDM